MEGLAVKSTDSIVHIVCATWRQMPVCVDVYRALYSRGRAWATCVIAG